MKTLAKKLLDFGDISTRRGCRVIFFHPTKTGWEPLTECYSVTKDPTSRDGLRIAPKERARVPQIIFGLG